MRTLWPRTEDLAFDPELAALALLDAAFAIAVQALIARNPELLLRGDTTLTPPPLAIAARSIVFLYRDLSDAVDHYRALLPPSHDDLAGDDIPF